LLWFREQFIHENAIDIMLYPCQLNMALNMFDGPSNIGRKLDLEF